MEHNNKASHYIPEELISGILLRLPISSLRRFRCVSKSWCSLLSNPAFIYKSLFFIENDHRPDDTKILIKFQEKHGPYPEVYGSISYDSLTVEPGPYRDWPQDVGLKIRYPNPHPTFKPSGDIAGSCGGLICLRYSGGYAAAGGYYAPRARDPIVLFNPATSKIKLLPPPLNLEPCSEYQLRLEAFGFGFDQQTNDYKVVSVLSVYSHKEGCFLTLAHVCSMADDSWREVDAKILPPHPHIALYNREIPQYCPRVRLSGRKGKCFWVGHKGNLPDDDRDFAIVSFDMSTEAFQVSKFLPNPCNWDGGSTDAPVVFMLKEDTVAIFHCAGGPGSGLAGGLKHWQPDSEQIFEIWVLQQRFDSGDSVGESWCKLFSICLDPWPIMVRPKGLSKEGKVIFDSLDDGLSVLDPVTGQMDALPVEGGCTYVTLETYVPSMLPLLQR